MDAIEERNVVASCDTREDAAAVVDDLAAEGFPVRTATIVGRGVHFIEDVTGRRTATRTVATVTVPAAIVGALLIGVLEARAGGGGGMVFYAALTGAIAGALVGLLLGAAMHKVGWLRRFRSSGTTTTAARYDVLADACVAPAARNLVGTTDDGADSP